MDVCSRSLLRYILYVLILIHQVEQAYCERFECFFDICDTKDNQFCNQQERICNYCSPQQCRPILEKDVKQCEEFCKNFTSTTLTTTTTSESTPQYHNNSPPPWWYIFIGVVVVAILVVVSVILIIMVVDKYKKTTLHKDRRAGGTAAEQKVLLESQDSGFENQNGGEQPEIIEMKDLSCLEATPNGLQSPHHDHYDHDQSKMLAGHNSVNPPSQKTNQIRQPYTYPGEDKSRHERVDPSGLSLHNHGRELRHVSVCQTPEWDQTKPKYC